MPRSLGDLPNEIFQLIYEVQVGMKMLFIPNLLTINFGMFEYV